MGTHPFKSRLQKALWALARRDGFEGSGATLRRVSGPTVHVVNIQSAGAKACYLNLGAHLTFLPPEGGVHVEPGKLMEYHCAFRERMHPPPGPDFGWAYLDDPQEASQSVEFVLTEWSRVARPFFAAHGSYSDSISAPLTGNP